MKNAPLTIIVIGASGDLAQGKIIPALFALASRGLLPDRYHVVGFARTAMTDDEFRARCRANLTCRYTPRTNCAEHITRFLERCRYFSGQYDDADTWFDFHRFLRDIEETAVADRMFYLALPPDIFTPVARAIGNAGLVSCDDADGWSRIIIEKPFGRDRASSDRMVEEMGRVFSEQQIYRIDHYLGKDVVQNLLVLRFANTVFEPVWNRTYIHSVQVQWSEDIGIGKRGRYFDEYGIIRDVIQNHLMQVLALVAMEQPRSLKATDVRDAKVRLLRSIRTLESGDVLLGQYRGTTRDGRFFPDYLAEQHVQPDSNTPTFAAMRLRIDNDRWDGVPFLITAGKALNARRSEIVVRFKAPRINLFCDTLTCLGSNEMRIRIQPDEAIHLRITNKVPDLDMRLAVTDLDLHYAAVFGAEKVPEAYESLLLDAIRGDRGLFIRADELAAAWDIFTPILHDLEARRVTPLPYLFGSRGPVEMEQFMSTV